MGHQPHRLAGPSATGARTLRFPGNRGALPDTPHRGRRVRGILRRTRRCHRDRSHISAFRSHDPASVVPCVLGKHRACPRTDRGLPVVGILRCTPSFPGSGNLLGRILPIWLPLVDLCLARTPIGAVCLERCKPQRTSQGWFGRSSLLELADLRSLIVGAMRENIRPVLVEIAQSLATIGPALERPASPHSATTVGCLRRDDAHHRQPRGRPL